MRTAGDDIAEVLALIGVRPVWDPASRRISDLRVVPVAELGRPRIDVTVRISGFFRDAFPHVVTMLDDAMRLVAGLDEPADVNYVRAHAQADLAEHGDQRRATTRIFGSAPGAYGAGLLPLMESGNWRDDADLAQAPGGEAAEHDRRVTASARRRQGVACNAIRRLRPGLKHRRGHCRRARQDADDDQGRDHAWTGHREINVRPGA
mgnify:CR=1 FL=1